MRFCWKLILQLLRNKGLKTFSNLNKCSASHLVFTIYTVFPFFSRETLKSFELFDGDEISGCFWFLESLSMKLVVGLKVVVGILWGTGWRKYLIWDLKIRDIKNLGISRLAKRMDTTSLSKWWGTMEMNEVRPSFDGCMWGFHNA